MNKNPTKSELCDLLRKCDDDAAHHIMWVSYSSDVHITSLPKHLSAAEWAQQNEDNIKWRNEMWVCGNKYVGSEAGDDDKWIEMLFNHLKKQWELNTIGYVDSW